MGVIRDGWYVCPKHYVVCICDGQYTRNGTLFSTNPFIGLGLPIDVTRKEYTTFKPVSKELMTWAE